MWVFGYGSLMWDGWEADFGGTRVDRAELLGYRRSFNKRSVKNWGTRETPAPTLGLEPCQGGCCLGTAFEFAEEQHEAIKAFLRGREGASFALAPLLVLLPGGREICAVVPVNDRAGVTYIGNVGIEERARLARAAAGASGRCSDYVRNIRTKLNDLRIQDAQVEEFLRLVEQE
jgi:glutathione-specific gamma-glutamylcyclotransferase